MRAEIVAVGTELLLGQIANTNARWMSERLAAIGVDVLHHQVVGDNLDRVVAALREASSRADVVLVTGGLGPTQDDLTRDAIAAAMGAPLVRHDELEEMLREKFAGFSSAPMPLSNLRQADVPQGARYIRPERGTAPGLIAPMPGGAVIYAVAGVPREMIEMMEGTILPELAERAGGAIASRVLRVVGMGESAVAERLDDLYAGSTNPTVAFLAEIGEVKVRLTAKSDSREEADRLLAPMAAEVAARLGDLVSSDRDETLEAVVLRLLGEAGKTLAVAEPPGASRSFVGGVVTYTAEAKQAVLGVSAATIASEGVVSEAVARQMAAGVRALYGADLGLALTGAAGPEPHGGEAPGRVWIALDAAGSAHARGLRSSGERDRIRRWSGQAALDLVRRFLAGLPMPGA